LIKISLFLCLFLDFSLSDWGTALKIDTTRSSLTSELSALLMQQIGLGTQLIDPACNRADDQYLPSSGGPSSGGWKNGLFGIWFSVFNVKKSSKQC
jgi:hypothetical protein